MIKNGKKRKGSTRTRCRIQNSNKPIDHFCQTCSQTADKIYCKQCKQTYNGLCPHQHQVYYKDTKLSSEQLSSPQRAKLTCPRSVYCGKSHVPNAGIGVFTSKFLKPETFFGPYLGIRHRSHRKADESAYAWTIEYPNGRIHSYVDAFDPFASNWLRYVNCSCSLAQENLVPIQYNANIFYKTSRAIRSGEELLVYYGDDYARVLGIQPFDNSARNYQVLYFQEKLQHILDLSKIQKL